MIPPTSAPVLVACAHGTRTPAGRRAVGALVAATGAVRPGLLVRAAFVDVQPPSVDEVVRGVRSVGAAAVVVPLLLSTGFHVGVDVARAVEGDGAVAAPALGPDPRITAVLLDRLRHTGSDPFDAVVVAAAGSSDPRAAADVEVVAGQLRALWAGPVSTGFGSIARPSVAEAVAAARAAGAARVVVAAYLLAPGFFHDRLRSAGADAVTAPLLHGEPDPRLVEVVLARYDAAVLLLTRT